jgi:hypothetical protein
LKRSVLRAKAGKSGMTDRHRPDLWAGVGQWKGHEYQLPPPRLSGCSVIRKQTVAATRGNGQDALIPAIRVPKIGLPKSTPPGGSPRPA